MRFLFFAVGAAADSLPAGATPPYHSTAPMKWENGGKLEIPIS